MSKNATSLAAALLLLAATAAHGADIAPMNEAPVTAPLAPASSEWIFQITPYVWAAGMEGDVSPFRRAPTIHVEKDFSDILDDLNVAGFVNFWARKDRFVISGDVMYVDIAESATSRPLPIIGAISADYDTAQFAATLQAGYRVYDAPRFTFDVLGGARYWHLWNDLNVRVAGRSLTIESDFDWIDPVVGARAHFHFNDRFSILSQGDIGGFGAGSDFTWQVLATANYSFNKKVTLSAGYKVLSVDYDDDGHVFDTTLSGPVLGLTYRF
ncbi:hypothetical protein [Chelativorans sp. AA-79]|uniref:outer membrane protein n=1 Tax=Chelativorans sp. AA-79 TaxID=3028735 RepID=UPI0023F6F0A1|nr:hypothetical protein [Chelativorans sp. AA-79]WEX07512.1 hypothetical protein PVE73_15460 [Chelativorans sp. AA-79]